MMAPPLEGNPQESSRELRVWRSQEILIVLHTNCGGGDGAPVPAAEPQLDEFYDIKGANATNPQLLHANTRDTHEFFIWEDPKNPKRALMFAATAGDNFAIYDLSPLLNADPPRALPVRLFQGDHGFAAPPQSGSGIHSFSVSNDGKRAYFALLTRGFGVADVSDFTDTDPDHEHLPARSRRSANKRHVAGPGRAQRDQALEQGLGLRLRRGLRHARPRAGHGCPWGWTRFIDINDPTQPAVVGGVPAARERAAHRAPRSTRRGRPTRRTTRR